MKTKDFYYDLPEELIAQTPVEPRDASRLMTLDKTTGAIGHYHFRDIVDLLQEGDCLILNDSRVLPARIYGVKEDTGAHVEFLLLENKGNDRWEALAGPGKKARKGSRFTFGDGLLRCEVVDVLPDGNRLIQFQYEGVFFNLLDQIGQMPLPPYIKEKLQDRERYQTVYSREVGSAAAPTAGLHFTPELLERVKAKGVKLGFVTLHVGLGTFRPVSAEDIQDHKMHAEHYHMPQETADLINETKEKGGRGHRRGHHQLPDHRVRGTERGLLQRKRGLDGHLPLPRVPVQGPGRPDHQLPPAGEHPDHVSVCPGRPGARAPRL